MHKQGMQTILDGHIHLQSSELSPCQHIEWPTPTPYNMGWTLMPTCLNFKFFGKKPSMKGKDLKVLS
jgi:hypothetical protein